MTIWRERFNPNHPKTCYNQLMEVQMDNSVLLARFWGGFGLIVSFLYLIRPNLLKNVIKEFDHESGTTIDAGYVTLILGVASLALYGKWSFDWRVLITIFGWLSVFKGARILAFPEYLKTLGSNERLLSMMKPILFIYCLLSAFLLYNGLSM